MLPRRISRARVRMSAKPFSRTMRSRPAAQLAEAARRLPASAGSASASRVRSRSGSSISG